MDKKGILIIGAGGVSSVATFKCAQNIDTFDLVRKKVFDKFVCQCFKAYIYVIQTWYE